jgi:hypothetical protein
MDELDERALEALLDLNPQVDRKVIKARQEKLSKEGPRVRISGDAVSPYSGRRVAPDDQVKWRSENRPGRRRTRYQSM